MELVIGSKRYSSWSMRPWLVLRRAGLEFTETLIALSRQGATRDDIAVHSPSGFVPVLRFEGAVVWDSLAICEYVADRYPEAGLWPADPILRAVARAATAEMHSGFAALRTECPMDLPLRETKTLSEAAAADVRRIVDLWSEMRREAAGNGAFLFGEWGIADAFYTPVATRFRSYGVDLAAHGDRGGAAEYASALLATPDFIAWEADA
jgi:glutathione S-transferase